MNEKDIAMNEVGNEEHPVWLTEDHKIIEPEFCASYLAAHPMRCIHGHFYTVDGLLPDESRLKKAVYDEISPWLESKIAKKVDELLNALKMAAYSEPMPLQCDRLHVANGTYYLDGRFSAEKEFCRNRLNVAYRPDTPAPERWLRFLSELLAPEDIPTLQEYLGYCLLPTTKGQKMLMLIGKGGEGKSRIGLVMGAVFGTNMNTTSIQKVESNRFSRADLENRLLMVDDDMDFSALPKTNYIKSIVTSECKMDLERKGVQSYQGQLYVRFLCFGNGALTALHDRSDGFFRRQIVLTTKDRPADRMDDPFLSEKLIEEKDGIFLWMLEGLHRLIANSYRFTISDRARENIASAVRNANNAVDFLGSEGYLCFKADHETSTKVLYAAYKLWCEDNAENALSAKSFSSFLAQNADAYHLEPTNNIHLGGGKRCRGYVGVGLLVRPTEI
jgi:putative DNA primase/helicase